MIRMVDTDGDGQVSESEFVKMIFRYAPQIPPINNSNPETGAIEARHRPQSPPQPQVQPALGGVAVLKDEKDKGRKSARKPKPSQGNTAPRRPTLPSTHRFLY